MASSNTYNPTHFSGKTLISINDFQLPLKLNYQNYPTWGAHIDPLLHGHIAMGYFIASTTSPPTNIEKDGQEVSNPEFEF